MNLKVPVKVTQIFMVYEQIGTVIICLVCILEILSLNQLGNQLS
jgi:hypothetical protein